MPPADGPRYEPPDATRPIYTDPEPPREDSNVVLVVALVAIVLVAIGGWYWYRHRTPPPPPVTAAPSTPAAQPPEAPAATPQLPELGASDALVRDLVAKLSARPELAGWLVNDDLARRFVASVVNVAEGTSPTSHLRFLTPHEAFRVRKTDAGYAIDPASFHRYDTATQVFESLDDAGTAALFHRLHPLFDAAYTEVGDPRSGFDDALARAVDRLLAVPVSDGPFPLVFQGAVFAWADHSIEERPSVEKLLLRMGPDNARRVQAKLRELAPLLGIHAEG